MNCHRCMHENRAGAKFCEECAAPMIRACANCGFQLSPTANFCSECAHPTGYASSPTSTKSHYSERIGEQVERLAHHATCGEIWEKAEQLDDLSLKVVATYYLGTAYFTAGDYKRAGDSLNQTIELLAGDLGRERLGMAGFPVVMARVFWAWGLAERGKIDEGMTHGLDAVRLAETLNHPYSLAFAYRALGQVYSVKGDFSQAIPLLERGAALCREWNLRFVAPTLDELLGYMYVLAGRESEGLDLLSSAVAAAESIGFSMFLTPTIVHLCEAQLLANQVEEATVNATRALALARKHGQRSQEAWAQSLLGEAAAIRDPLNLKTAEGAYQEAMTLATGLDMRPLLAHCHVGLGMLSRLAGKPEHAMENFAIATAMWREMDTRFWLEKAEAEMKGLT